MARSIAALVVSGCAGQLAADLDSWRHIIADFNREKLNLHLSHAITALYDCSCFSASKLAILLYTTVAAGPIPPVAEKTSRVKHPCSTSRTLSSIRVQKWPTYFLYFFTPFY